MIKVAIVEDDFRVAMIHEEFLLQVKGVKLVGKALNGKETIELLEKKEIDLLLLDIYMPDVLGVELMKEVRLNHPKVDIIMITAATEMQMVESALRNGVIDYILKPVTIERFKTTIEHYLQRKKFFEQKNEMTQDSIDQYLGTVKPKTIEKEHTPTGIDPITLEKIKEIMTQQDGITADEAGEIMGASRTTARRYLEYLISIGAGKAELSYGIVGRPERKYYLTS
ncbi:response regulator [Alkalihalobacillus deserti]|uniref:response regulator n=1 Tax=Alkalihalobacillus deserti TaxID=2879466 RepID=UPI001D150B9A|nr:response regulator [Alkalihalobacillus deserti]